MKHNPTKRPGLILLVVLGMLALFSLLAITYVLFSGHSRAASVALERSESRGNKSRKPLFDEAIMQVIRGTTDNRSVAYGNSLLGDLFGELESVVPATAVPTPSPLSRQAVLLQIRNWEYDVSNPANTTSMTFASSSYQRPMILAGHFLRIPLDPGGNYSNPVNLPWEHDVLNARIVTFPAGNGPLSGQSFHIVRYIGGITPFPNPTTDDRHYFAQNYSIVIDLLETDLSKTYSRYDSNLTEVESHSLGEWAHKFPPGGGNGAWQAGVYACFKNIDLSGSRSLNGGYQLLLNAVPLNSHGVGVFNDGRSQTHILDPTAGSPLAGTPINQMATGLLPNIKFLESEGILLDADNNQMVGLSGDADEPWDAADFANYFLAFRESGARSSTGIIPSFHRAALVNYIVNWKDPRDYTPQEFLATIRRIESACGRPLSINVITPEGNYVTDPHFTGGNAGQMGRSPQLMVNIPSNWTTGWPATGLDAFQDWVRWLTLGPWDVDNDADGIADSMWVDVNLPLETSADGKLLKAMVAFYIEDLDNKLDVNATASNAQTLANYTAPVNAEFARHQIASPNYLTQGLGYGPAEISFRPLFAKSPRWNPPFAGAGVPAQQNAFQRFLQGRYRDNSSMAFSPGTVGDDAVSQLRMREQSNIFRHGLLPGLPLGTHGRATLGLDRLGNPRVMNVDGTWGQSIEDPYESRWMSAPFQDSPYTLAEWERIYRIGDSDRSALPKRLETAMGEVPNTLPTSSLRHEITTHSSHLRTPILAARGTTNQRPSSFLDFVNTLRMLRADLNSNPDIPMHYGDDKVVWRGFPSLFPLEFKRGLPMDVNRPFGNGVDDDDDGQIDEPQELFSWPQIAYKTTGQITTGTSNVVEDGYRQGQPAVTPDDKQPFDPNLVYTGDNATADIYLRNLETRQLFARHLYCLAQLIIPQDYVFPNVDSTTYAALSVGDKELLRARILAQWAVNVVDFRDLDSAMTRFPYDPRPFELKLDNGTTPATPHYAWEPPPTTVGQPSYVVWGMEQPELLITESWATHDIRIKRNAGPPARYDQYRIPEGSLFLEFFCPRTTSDSAMDQSAAGVSPALYNTAAGALDLTRPAPGGAPVWRVYISDPHDPDPAIPSSLDVYNDPVRKHLLSYQVPESNHQFDVNGVLVPNAAQNALDAGLILDRELTAPVPAPDTSEARILVFASGFVPDVNNSPGVADPQAQVFVSETGGVQLSGGQYLVVGPRETTYFGSKLAAWVPGAPVNRPNNHRLELIPGWAQMVKTDNTDVLKRATMRDSFTAIASSAIPSNWVVDEPRDRTRVGLNVSEPVARATGYYSQPTITVNPNDNSTDPDNDAVGFGNANHEFDAYYDYTLAASTALPPFDNGDAGPLSKWQPDPAAPAPAVNPTTQAVNVGTQENWCTAYLQRLADPEKPWNASFNPYLTVDWMPIDLTVFSGEENHEEVYPSPTPPGQEIKFASRQKTGQPLQVVSNEIKFDDQEQVVPLGVTFYSPVTHPPRETYDRGTNLTFFDYEAYMDEVAGTATIPIRPTRVNLKPSDDDQNVNESFMTLGFLNSTYRIAGEESGPNPSSFVGVPADPVNAPATTVNETWIPLTPFWSNRSFVNPYELTMVPLSSPGQFTQEFSALDLGAADSRYAPISGANSLNPFRHLLSFTQEFADDNATPATKEVVPMAVLFELLETPSPWSDANVYENPEAVASQNPADFSADFAPVVAATNNILAPLRAPYNRISRFVEPGRLNLNTMSEMNVFHGLWFNSLSPNERATLNNGSVAGPWQLLTESRRGYNPGGGTFNTDATRFNSAVPTQFAGVFKPAMEAGMGPATWTAGVLDATAASSPANATLMRADNVTGAGAQPLFRSGYDFADKNAFTDTHPITRLVNLTSGRSNVFAIYITLGFFEYDQGTGGLKQEYGADKGETRRYKAFYVIDRSKPVGFQVGEDHNAENTILIRRYLDH